MIVSVKIKNFMIFKDEVEISFEANGYIKKFSDNCYESNGHKIVKCACFYGPNNVGKSCIVNAIGCIQSVLMGNGFPETIGEMKNFYTTDKDITLGIKILNNDKLYAFEFSYLEPTTEYPRGRFTHEKFSCFDSEKEVERIIYERREKPGTSVFADDIELAKQMDGYPRHNIFPAFFDANFNEHVDKCNEQLLALAKTIIICDNPTTPQLTIDILKSKNQKFIASVKQMIREIDVDINDFGYEKKEHNKVYERIIKRGNQMSEAQRQNLLDQCSLYSVHGDKKVESLVYDSRGTKEVVTLAGLVVAALYNNLTLVVDEFDNGLHARIMREIVSMFNNGTNDHAQLIIAAQNTELMDTKTLFRKDQIWFLHREKGEHKNDAPEILVYRLDDFNYHEDHVRSETDVATRYREGLLGAVPNPNVYDVMRGIEEARSSGQR